MSAMTFGQSRRRGAQAVPVAPIGSELRARRHRSRLPSNARRFSMMKVTIMPQRLPRPDDAPNFTTTTERASLVTDALCWFPLVVRCRSGMLDCAALVRGGGGRVPQARDRVPSRKNGPPDWASRRARSGLTPRIGLAMSVPCMGVRQQHVPLLVFGGCPVCGLEFYCLATALASSTSGPWPSLSVTCASRPNRASVRSPQAGLCVGSGDDDDEGGRRPGEGVEGLGGLESGFDRDSEWRNVDCGRSRRKR